MIDRYVLFLGAQVVQPHGRPIKVHHASMQIINTHPPTKHENSIGEICIYMPSTCRIITVGLVSQYAPPPHTPTEVEKCTDVIIKSAMIKHILMHDLI
jgi:hypothetical protein